MNNKLICLIAESGTGKSTITQELFEARFNVICSYTTRAPRFEGENSHIFTTIDKYNEDKAKGIVIAETCFDECIYWASKDQYQGKGVTFYVVDPYGFDVLKKTIDDAEVIGIYLKCDKSNRRKRMNNDNRSDEDIKRRIKHDKNAFRLVRCDYVVDGNNSVSDILSDILVILDRIIN